MSAETIDQWYTILQETYDKWNNEVIRLRNENEDGSLNKQINQILPTLERYKYYLDQKPLQETTTPQENPDLISFD
jgi:DNA integrity scanning protein DisA with diadenylate cyclase activity